MRGGGHTDIELIINNLNKRIVKIAVLTSGILPIPAVQGGAVENLIDYYLDYNNKHHLHDITVYSVWHPKVKSSSALNSTNNHYIYIDVDGWWAKIKKKIFKMKHGDDYYNYTIEYYFEQAFKHLQKQQYDLIILENRPGYALKLKGKVTGKIVYHIHNDILNNESKYASEIYKSASRIITVSNYIRGRVHTINPSDKKCVTIHNGIDTLAFSMDVTPAHIPSLNNNDFIIVFSGRINDEKGIMELISAMTLLGKASPIKLLVLGSPFYGNVTHEDSFICKLKDMAEPIRNRIVFTGYISHSEMPHYLKMADIAIIPSVWDDPFPTTVLEAQAMGLPIITTQRGGIPEEVSTRNAILLKTDNQFIDNLTDAILDLYKNPQKRERMANESKKRAKLFDKNKYAENFFKELVP